VYVLTRGGADETWDRTSSRPTPSRWACRAGRSGKARGLASCSRSLLAVVFVQLRIVRKAGAFYE